MTGSAQRLSWMGGLAMIALLMRLPLLAFAVLLAGSAAAFLLARRRDDNPLWHAAGVLYLGVPALALAGLRLFPHQGALVVLGLFLIVWATDTGALCFGKLIGGAKLAPRLSPGKTWAGTIGGSVTAALVFGLYIGFFGRPMLAAMGFALVFSAVAHGGDLFESWVKRRFDTKDSGSIIPGHGGLLDRLDGLGGLFRNGLNPGRGRPRVGRDGENARRARRNCTRLGHAQVHGLRPCKPEARLSQPLAG